MTDFDLEDFAFAPGADEAASTKDQTAIAYLSSPARRIDQDSKYNDLQSFLLDWLHQYPHDKIIVFSFFRGTLAYLQQRLKARGLKTALILGGMGEVKDDELVRFADPDGPNILLSSEVGSEGVDLQFARVVVNYDLPWNPMRVEQRIGRIDRLGQKSDKIYTVSLVLGGPIDAVILERLYDRIKIFSESIGDIEEILGESIDNVLIGYFREGLRVEQVGQRLEQNAIVAVQQRHDLAQLEQAAPDLTSSTDFILSSLQSIQDTRDTGRWIRPDDVRDFVKQMLLEHYPGSPLEADPNRAGVYSLLLSPQAGADLSQFCERERPFKGTRLRTPGRSVLVLFDASLPKNLRNNFELLNILHPLVAFLRYLLDKNSDNLQPIMMAALPAGRSDAPPGTYLFATDRWRFRGVRRDIRLQSLAISAADQSLLPPGIGERLIEAACRYGEALDHATFPDFEAICDAFGACVLTLSDR